MEKVGKGWERLGKAGKKVGKVPPSRLRHRRSGIKTEIRSGIRTGTIRVLPELKQLGRARVNNGLEMIDFTLGKNGFIAAKVS